MLAAVLVIRFLRTGGPAMLRMMDAPPDDAAHDVHSDGGGAATPRRYTCPMLWGAKTSIRPPASHDESGNAPLAPHSAPVAPIASASAVARNR